MHFEHRYRKMCRKGLIRLCFLFENLYIDKGLKEKKIHDISWMSVQNSNHLKKHLKIAKGWDKYHPFLINSWFSKLCRQSCSDLHDVNWSAQRCMLNVNYSLLLSVFTRLLQSYLIWIFNSNLMRKFQHARK